MSPLWPQKRQTYEVYFRKTIRKFLISFGKRYVLLNPNYIPGLYFVWQLTSGSVNQAWRVDLQVQDWLWAPLRWMGDQREGGGDHVGVSCNQGKKHQSKISIKAKQWATRWQGGPWEWGYHSLTRWGSAEVLGPHTCSLAWDVGSDPLANEHIFNSGMKKEIKPVLYGTCVRCVYIAGVVSFGIMTLSYICFGCC